MFQPPKISFFLFGPRGTGKTTWLRSTFPQALWVDLLEPDRFRQYSAKPERLRELVLGNPDKQTVVIDEVQKVPELLSVVHGLREEEKHRQFILTGSSARKLRRAGTDLMAGRLALKHLHPFMAGELGKSFSLEKALRQGLVPLVWDAADPKETLKAYVALYLREEVQAESLVRNIGNFSRFLEATAFSHGAILNVSSIARECQVERKVVASYLGILEDLLLSFRLGVFTKRAKRETSSHEKIYYMDPGVFRVLRSTGPLDRTEEVEGAALEGMVAQHLRAWIDYRGDNHRLFFWRTRKGVEVDMVLYGESGLWAFEVKNTTRIRPEDLRGLTAFAEDYPESRLAFLYRGKERMKRGKIWCLPCEDFLSELDPFKMPFRFA